MDCTELTDPVALCVELLRTAIPTAEVSEVMPPTHPKKPYAMPSLTGFTSKDFIERPAVTITCWDASDAAANRLARACVFALQEAALDHPALSAVELVAIVRDEYAPAGYGCYEAQTNLTINEI